MCHVVDTLLVYRSLIAFTLKKTLMTRMPYLYFISINVLFVVFGVVIILENYKYTTICYL